MGNSNNNNNNNRLSVFGLDSESENEEEGKKKGNEEERDYNDNNNDEEEEEEEGKKHQTQKKKPVRHITTPTFPLIPPEVEMCSMKFPPEIAIKINEYDEESHRKEILDKMKAEKEGYSERKEDDAFIGPQCFIRWKYKYDENGDKIKDPVTGKPIRISNTRLVKFTNGDMQLIVGEDRFNVNRSEVKELFLAQQYDHHSNERNSDTIPSLTHYRKGQDLENDFSVFEMCGKMTNKYSLIPDSKLYDKLRDKRKRLLENMREKTVGPVIVSQNYQDPHEHTKNKIRMEDYKEKLRRRGGIKVSSVRRPAMSSNYLEENDDEEDAGQYDTMNISSLRG